MAELVHLDIDKRVATITLDSEHNRNALSKQLVSELMAHVETADADPEVRVIVIRSAGPVFCSGADMVEASAGGMVEGAKSMVAMQLLIATATTPVVVELDGPVRAGGLGIVGAADIVLAAEPVTFQLTEVRLALAPAIISLSLVPRLTDRAASELFLTARTFDAVEAAQIGLVTRAVPAAELADEVDRVVGDLAKGYPQGLRETKKLLNHDLVTRIDTLGAGLAQLSGELFGSDEAREAMAAFLNRRR
ncbi:enoyl-CoA hydratase-related protein [Aeromicrobium chenweiae]|uniref:Enoyl-CoA hydratase n=1 Tax=Aeromicrobium chenweiae TaxID=2079793 RepID=A0A2S0WR64_9ACTN|nr:enoyl-CoA hydratase-related protein [Aeromicrobium chenweiae]AWB93853.1 enoyl-CoA hydratase [Aeromicrobium chenweiae]TGN30898.1 enoyl-CoA hydratase [Aeromicrobium chenweiae]